MRAERDGTPVDERAWASSVLSSWSRSTIGRVSCALIAPPSAIVGLEFGPGWSATWRPATLESDVLRIVAIVPACSGLKRGSSMRSVICAWLSLVRSIAWTVPTVTPPTFTRLPFTSWPALSTSARTS